jgi:hypothetical protein
MNRILKIAGIALVILILPFVMAKGQEKKSEQKIKIIVNDGSGTKVVIDTVFKDRPVPDSLKLKDGSFVYIKHHGDDADSGDHKGKEHFYVTYSSDGKHNGNVFKEVTVIASDSTRFTEPGDSDNIMVYHRHRSDEGRDNIRYKVITRDSNDQGDNDSSVEKTRYVIAKNGMVVTIEGTDEARAKELAKVIEEKLGVNSEETGKKEMVRVESKKTIKK